MQCRSTAADCSIVVLLQLIGYGNLIQACEISDQSNAIEAQIIIASMGMSSLTVDRSNGSIRKVDSSFDFEGMVFPLLKPIATTLSPSRTEISSIHEQQKGDFLQNIDEVTVENELLAKVDQDGGETPKSEEHKIPKVLECPPAPRKPRPAPKRKTATLPEGFFFFPPEVESAFLLYRMSPPRKKLQWSKRISTVALEQDGGHHM